MKIESRPRVILRACATYDTEKIRAIVREGLEELGLEPHGRTLVKPNCVASGATFPHAYTRPEFLEGVLLALQDKDRGRMSELAVGERCGITVPTRASFDGAVLESPGVLQLDLAVRTRGARQVVELDGDPCGHQIAAADSVGKGRRPPVVPAELMERFGHATLG